MSDRITEGYQPKPRADRSGQERDDRPTWKPIATAPKDGRAIIVGLADGTARAVRWACVPDSGEGWYETRLFWSVPTIIAQTVIEAPTYWIPISEPPR